MTDQCEPPPELRGVDGWHWVQLPFVSVPTPMAWMLNPDNEDREWRMPSSPAFVSGESKTAKTWCYLAPAATPAEVDAMRAEVMRASTECADAMAQVVALRARVALLEGALRSADQFITNGVELGYIRMPTPGTSDAALKTPGIVRAALFADA